MSTQSHTRQEFWDTQLWLGEVETVQGPVAGIEQDSKETEHSCASQFCPDELCNLG